MKIKHLILILVLVSALGLVSCTRSASEAPTQVPGTDATQTSTDQQPPSNMETAVAGGGFATQTAQAAVTPGEPVQGETPTEETGTAAPDATPVPENTPEESESGGGVDPTEVPPLAPTEPATTTGGSCTSPYTVLAGEWIWSIGRKCNISPQAILDANPTLACYYDAAGRLQCTVYAGTQLILPAGAPPFTGP
jgi:hypothetical protein